MNSKLESKRLDYRFFEESDLDSLIKLLGNDQVCQYLPEKKAYPDSLIKRVLEYYIQTTKAYRFQHIYFLSLKETKEFIGYVGIQIVKEFDKYEIFYALLPEYWGKGYATEAAFRMKELAKEIELKEVIALADVENIGSQKVLEKTGYTKKSEIKLWGLNLYYYEMSL